jgi:hypothetical protein
MNRGRIWHQRGCGGGPMLVLVVRCEWLGNRFVKTIWFDLIEFAVANT